jgi:hydrogenase/urease accessory protein HupE
MTAHLSAALVALALLLPASAGLAHDFTPGVLSIVERTAGRYEIAWAPPVDSGEELDVRFALPTHCRLDEERRWADCGAEGLRGAITFPGLRDHRARVVIRIEALHAPPAEHLVSGDAPELSLDRPPGDSFVAWLRLGVEHIAFGFDHLAFLFGLLLVAGVDRRALLTVTAFTVAHSITLALAALDLVHLASAPVEATIAASVILVARESTHDEPTLTRRWPWLVAAVFGLVHGLGFAGALREIGLPRDSVIVPLLGFNLGVELGQLAIVAVAVVALHLARRWKSPPTWLRPASAYAIGALGAFWLIDRAWAIITAPSPS